MSLVGYPPTSTDLSSGYCCTVWQCFCRAERQAHCINTLQKDFPNVQWMMLLLHLRGLGVRHNSSTSAGIWGEGGNPRGNSWHHFFPSRFPFSLPNPIQQPSLTAWIKLSRVLFSSQLFRERYFWERNFLVSWFAVRLCSERHTKRSGQFIYLQLGFHRRGVCL